MKNKTFIFVGLALLAIAVYLIAYPIRDSSSSSAEAVVGEDDTDITQFQADQVSSVDEFKASLPIFEKIPSPVVSISKEECASIDLNESFNLKRSQIFKAAAQAYFAGSPKQEVADGIWAQLNWWDAYKWYTEALDYESLNRDLPILQSLPQASSLVSKIEDFNARLAAGNQVDTFIDMSSEKQSLWTHISLDQANQALLSNEPTENVLAKLNEALIDIPEQLLTNTQLSPIPSIIASSVKSKRIDVAIALLNQYPNLAQFANSYEHQFRAQVLASLNYDLSDETLKRDVDILLSIFDLYETSLSFYQLPGFFDRLDLQNKLIRLEQQNINIPYQEMSEVEAPDAAIALWYDKELYERIVAKETECTAKKTWIEERSLAYTQWQQFVPDDFVSEVKNSFEYDYCSIKTDVFGPEPDFNAVEDSISLIVKDFQLSGKTLDQVELNEIDFPALSNDQRTILSVILTKELIGTKALSEQEVIQRLSEANLKPQTTNLTVLEELVLIKEFSLWFDEINFNDIPNSYLLLNTLAEKGKFELYMQLKNKIKAQDFDTFYFFIKGYSSLRSADGFLSYKVSTNAEFIEYFQQKGVNISPHHLRASYQLKHKLESNYVELIEHFPQLAVTQNEDYFSVKCE